MGAMETLIPSNTKMGRIASVLARDLERGRFAPGTLLPTERELARIYAVSPVTMRKCLRLLSQDGRLVRHPQRGMVVAGAEWRRPKIGQIAFIAPMLTTEAARYIKGFTQAIDHERFSLASYTPHGDFTKYQKVIENVVHQRPTGIVIWVSPDNMYHVDDQCLAAAKIPVVTLGQEMLPHE